MTTIMLIRHGETDWNVEEIFRGQMDVALNETGIAQAKLLAEYLKDIQIEAIYSSPLKRALKTAEIIAGYHHVKVESVNELTDFNYGAWQGLSHSIVREKYNELYDQWLKSPHFTKIPRGEILGDVKKRAMGLIFQIVKKYNGTIALVSHRVTCKVLICALLGLDNSHFWNIKLDTCGVTVFTYKNNRFVLSKHNDNSFLKPIGSPTLSDF